MTGMELLVVVHLTIKSVVFYEAKLSKAAELICNISMTAF